MANKTASLRFNLSYTAPGGGVTSLASSVQSVPYAAQALDTIDVPATTASATVYPISFGSVDTGATLLIVINHTDFPLTLTLNGGDLVQTIPVGEFALVHLGSVLGATPVINASVTTTGIQGADAGSVDTFVFGDPV